MRRTWPDLWVAVAREVATMSTCVRREVGCVLVDASNHVLATGFNGVPPGWPHCDPKKSKDQVYHVGLDVETCPGAAALPLGLTNSPVEGVACMASHAEANALLRCDTQQAHACYTTLSPCLPCLKLLLCSSVLHIVFVEPYVDAREQEDRWEMYHQGDPRNYRRRRWLRYYPGMRLPKE